MKKLLAVWFGLSSCWLTQAAEWVELESYWTSQDSLYWGDSRLGSDGVQNGTRDLTFQELRNLMPEIRSWGEQRNVAVDYSAGVFNNRLDLGLGFDSPGLTNFSPRLMPFGGPLSYSQGRDFTFRLEDSEFVEQGQGFLDYYRLDLPFDDTKTVVEASFGQFDSMTASLESEVNMGAMQMDVKTALREFGNFTDGKGVRLTDSLDLANPKFRYSDDADSRSIYSIREYQMQGRYFISRDQQFQISGKYTDASDVYFPQLRMDALYDRGSTVSMAYMARRPSASLQNMTIRAYASNAQQLFNDRLRVSKFRFIENPEADDFFTEARSRSSAQGFEMSGTKEYVDGQIGFGLRWNNQEWDAVTNTLGVISQMLPDISQTLMGGFIEGQRYVGNFQISGTLQIDQQETTANGSQIILRRYRNFAPKRADNSSLRSSMKLLYEINDNSNAYVQLGYSVRAPDPHELFLQYQHEQAPGNLLLWLGNPDLDEVRNTSMDIGYTARTRKLSFSMKGFYSFIQDLIYIENLNPNQIGGEQFIGTAISYNNIDALVFGGDLEVALDFTKNLRLEGGVEMLKGKKRRLNTFSGDEDLAEMPPLQGHVALSFDNDQIFGKFEVRMADAQLDVDESISEVRLDSYTILNLMMGYNLTTNTLWTVGVENIGDQVYTRQNANIRNPFTNYGIVNETGRFVFMSLKWQF